MAGFDRQELFSGIIRILDDTQRLEITKFDLQTYGHGDWPEISNALAEWEKRGFLQVVCNPEQANKDEVCVKMFSIHRDRQSPDYL